MRPNFRRKSVSAERYDPEAEVDDDEEKEVHLAQVCLEIPSESTHRHCSQTREEVSLS